MRRSSRLRGRRTAESDLIAIRTLGTAADAPLRRTPSPVWNDLAGLAPPYPELDGTVQADVCVIGLGAAGLSAVLHLADQGVDVVGLESGPVGGGASSRNAGFLLAGLAPFHHDLIEVVGRQRAIDLYQVTRDELARMRDDTPPGTRWTGSVRMAATDVEARDCARQYEVMRRDGLPVERYESDTGVGLYFPEDGVFQPTVRVRWMADRARDRGARLYAYTEAQHVGERDVSTATGEVRCRAVIVAVDGGLERIVPALDGVVRTARAQMLATAPTDEVRLPLPVYSRWGYDYWQQLPDGRIVLGGGRDHGGDAEWTLRTRPTKTVQRMLDELLRERLGVRDAPVTHRWAGSIGFTADGLPRIARMGRSTIAIGGYNGTGNVIGPMLGRAAADLAMGRPSALVELLST